MRSVKDVLERSISETDAHRTDVVILGSGAGGLTAALTASLNGLRAIVLEHSDRLGGTSARSSGTVWVPDNPYLRAHRVSDDRERAARYLASLLGERGERAMWHAFLDQAPPMLADLENRAGIGFRPYMSAPDYQQDHRELRAAAGRWSPCPSTAGRLARILSAWTGHCRN